MFRIPALIGAALLWTSAADAEVQRPPQGASFAWQLQGKLAAETRSAEVIDIDLFDTPQKTIADLKGSGKYVICYVSVGSWEKWRPDRDDFPAEAIGRPYYGWGGERWLDITRLDLIGPPLEARFDLARDKGCDAIEPDNLDAHEYRHGGEGTGFDITKKDQLRFVRWVIEKGQARGLAVGLKNVPEFVRQLGASADFAITEDCAEWRFCDDYQPMLERGLAVFHVHYTDTDVNFAKECRTADPRETLILKRRSLNGWAKTCEDVEEGR
jgi:hypothetical protein